MPTDDDLIQITAIALDNAYARAGTGSGLAPGDWMACKPGCHQCCIGVFPISPLDAARLKEALAAADPTTAAHIRRRASEGPPPPRARLPRHPAHGRTLPRAAPRIRLRRLRQRRALPRPRPHHRHL